LRGRLPAGQRLSYPLHRVEVNEVHEINQVLAILRTRAPARARAVSHHAHPAERRCQPLDGPTLPPTGDRHISAYLIIPRGRDRTGARASSGIINDFNDIEEDNVIGFPFLIPGICSAQACENMIGVDAGSRPGRHRLAQATRRTSTCPRGMKLSAGRDGIRQRTGYTTGSPYLHAGEQDLRVMLPGMPCFGVTGYPSAVSSSGSLGVPGDRQPWKFARPVEIRPECPVSCPSSRRPVFDLIFYDLINPLFL